MPPAAIDLIGKKINRWTILQIDLSKNRTYYICKCICGTLKSVRKTSLITDSSKSCGCLNREISSNRLKNNKYRLKHGHTIDKLPTYRSWYAMKRRCTDIFYSRYSDYGGRGIKVCDRWLESFINFLEDMGERPINTTIDRIDNNGNYEPLNCRWATSKQQSLNKRNTKNV